MCIRDRYDGKGVSINGILFPSINPNSLINLQKYRPDLFPLQKSGVVEISYDVIMLCSLEKIEFDANVVGQYNIDSRDIFI